MVVPVDVRMMLMIPGERNQVEANETQHSCESNVSSVLGDAADLNNAESMEDSAWLQACRKELHDDPESSETADNRSDSLAMPDQISDDGENLATRSEASDSQVATEKTGDDAMSKFGHATVMKPLPRTSLRPNANSKHRGMPDLWIFLTGLPKQPNRNSMNRVAARQNV